MSATLPALPPTSGTAPPGDFLTVCAWSAGVALLIPYALIGVIGGAALRAIYPAYILVASYFIIVNRRPLYPAFMLAVFAFAPFLRRVADYQAGFDLINPILLAPYIGLLPAIPALLRRALGGGGPMQWPFAAMLGCVVYAMFLALFRLEFAPACVEAVKWLLPPAIGAFIMAKPAEADAVHRAVIQSLCLVMPVLAIYGIYQFLYAPLWDVYWMRNIENPTFGEPAAFKIRVFSMMNSPGTLGVFASYAMILLAGEGLIALAIVALSLPLLALTLLRSGWLSLAVGLVALLARASAKRRLLLLSFVAAAGFAGASLFTGSTLSPEIKNLISDRFSTFSTLATDASAYDRLAVYDAFVSRLADRPLGEGFGANASTLTTRAEKHSLVAIDSGLLEAFLVYGIFGGTIYFLALAALVLNAWRTAAWLNLGGDANFAVVVAMVAILPLGSSEIGEIGVLAWVAMGTLFAQAGRRRQVASLIAPSGKMAKRIIHARGHSASWTGDPGLD